MGSFIDKIPMYCTPLTSRSGRDAAPPAWQLRGLLMLLLLAASAMTHAAERFEAEPELDAADGAAARAALLQHNPVIAQTSAVAPRIS